MAAIINPRKVAIVVAGLLTVVGASIFANFM